MSPNILRGRRDKYWKYFEIFLLIALYDLIFWSWQEGIRKFSGISVHPELELVVPDTDNSFFLPSQVSSIKEEPGPAQVIQTNQSSSKMKSVSEEVESS